MIRFFCDKCNKEIDKNSPYSSPFSDIENHVYNTYYVETFAYAEPRINKDGPYDHCHNRDALLCEECHKKLDDIVDKFMRDGEQS